jgi:hypothetical protein
MSRRHPTKSKRGSRAEAALSELCVRFGYCIPPEAAQAILAQPSADADAFLDAVIVAEGLDPTLMSSTMRRPLIEVVNDWLYDERGRGSVSDLPLFPSVG